MKTAGIKRRASAESGFVLPSAIFLVVILAALGGYMVTLSRTSHMSGALDIQGSRAYQAARAGMEWAAWQVVNLPPVALPNPVPTPCPLPFPSSFTPTGTLAAFAVTVTCVRTAHDDGGALVEVYQVTSTATSGVPGTVDYVDRQIQGSFSK
jgi:MSHA biogenesis protein MshP